MFKCVGMRDVTRTLIRDWNACDLMIKRCIVHYRGRVQGVGFRFTAVRQSKGLSVHGYVKNESDGSVLMDVEGATADVAELLRRIEMEMSGNIDSINLDERQPQNRDGGLVIRY